MLEHHAKVGPGASDQYDIILLLYIRQKNTTRGILGNIKQIECCEF